jgi:hypothetical protein
MWSAILGILNSGLSIVAGWFKAKQSPAEQASAAEKNEQAVDVANTQDVQDAIKKNDVSGLQK